MKPKHINKILFSEIKTASADYDKYCYDPLRNVSRNRKLSFETIVKSIIGMESKSLTNELIDVFNSSDMPSASAFVQQRYKIKPEVFPSVFSGFTNKLISEAKEDLPILAIDGSDIQTPANPKDEKSYYPGTNGQKAYNLLHLNALYDLKQHLYTDVVIQGSKECNEHSAFQKMIDRSPIPNALVIADRGYESYNSMAHLQEKGWFFLIRIKDGNTGIKKALQLPQKESFDVDISLKLTRKQTNETKEMFKDNNHYKFISHTQAFDYLPIRSKKADPVRFYELKFRIVRFKLKEDAYETVLTNLDSNLYPPETLKKLYASRWGIETSFRDLKYTVGKLSFHSKKVMCIHQEVYAHLIMYNFSEMITSRVAIDKKKRKHTYKANFSVAVHMCRLFFHGKTTSPNLEAIIARNLIPIRPERHHPRNLTAKVFHGFLYRAA